MKNHDLARLLNAAKVALRAGAAVEAEKLSRNALVLDPGNPSALSIIATIAIQRGRTDEAILALRELLPQDPNAWEPHETLCRLLLQKGELAEAIEYGRRACKLQPGAYQAHCSLGACYLEDRRLNEAAACLSQALELEPRHMPAHHYSGIVLAELGRFEEAEAEFREAIRLDPRPPQPYVHLTKLLISLRRDEEAKTCLESAIASSAAHPKWRLALASNLMNIGLHEQAEGPLRSALTDDPNSADALSLLGQLLQKTGRFKEAATCFERLIAAHPALAQAYFELFQCRKVTASDGLILTAVSKLIDKPGLSRVDERLLQYAAGKAQDDLGHFDYAIQHFRVANQISASHMERRVWNPTPQGRELERISQTFTADFFSRHRDAGLEAEAPILIVGMIRSGTSLVEQVLSSHPKVAAGGEQTYLFRCASLQTLPEAEILRQGRLRGEAYLQLIRSIAGSKRFATDKMPLNFAVLGLFHLMFPNGRIIHCRRNPADTCLSIYTTPFEKPVDFGHDPDVIIEFYRHYLRLMKHWQYVLPAHAIHHVDYEHVVANREAEIRKLLGFCDLEWDDACLNHQDRGGAVVTPSTWQVRQPIYGSSVGRWRNYDAWLPQFGQLNSDPLVSETRTDSVGPH